MGWLDFLCIGAPAASRSSLPDGVRRIAETLAHFEPARATHLACFAYILSRVAHVDQHVSDPERAQMVAILEEKSGLPAGQVALVVEMAVRQSEVFGGAEDFLVTREFNALATHEEKLALLECLFAVSSADHTIAANEDNEIRRISRELRIEHADFISMRTAYKGHLGVLRAQN